MNTHHFSQRRHLHAGVLEALAPALEVNAVTRVGTVESNCHSSIGSHIPEAVVHRVSE